MILICHLIVNGIEPLKRTNNTYSFENALNFERDLCENVILHFSFIDKILVGNKNNDNHANRNSHNVLIVRDMMGTHVRNKISYSIKPCEKVSMNCSYFFL